MESTNNQTPARSSEEQLKAKYGGKQDNGNCGVHEDPPEEFFLL